MNDLDHPYDGELYGVCDLTFVLPCVSINTLNDKTIYNSMTFNKSYIEGEK